MHAFKVSHINVTIDAGIMHILAFTGDGIAKISGKLASVAELKEILSA